MRGSNGRIRRLRHAVGGKLASLRRAGDTGASTGVDEVAPPVRSETSTDVADQATTDTRREPPSAGTATSKPTAEEPTRPQKRASPPEPTSEPLPLFDREIEQYDLVAAALTAKRSEVQANMDDCRDGGDRLEDFPQYWAQFQEVKAQHAELLAARQRYIADRDRLTAYGVTDAWVVAGSIVTVRFYDGTDTTFVLTERPSDTEYEAVPYSSPLGQAVRRKQVGDRVSLPAGAALTITRIEPGFRLTTKLPNRFARKSPKT